MSVVGFGLAGFVTVGAPAGIGVREAAIILALSGTMGEPTAITVALLFRVLTTLGDVLFFLLAQFNISNFLKGDFN